MRFGKTLVVQEVDRIDPVLYPLLRRDFSLQGPRKVVMVGDKVVDFSDSFEMFLVTRNSAPSISPDAVPLITMVRLLLLFALITVVCPEPLFALDRCLP